MPVCNFKKGTEISVACCGAAKKDYNNGQRVTVISFVISLERRERARGGGGLPVVMVLICLFSFQVIHKIVLLIHNNAYSEDSEQKRKKKALELCPVNECMFN